MDAHKVAPDVVDVPPSNVIKVSFALRELQTLSKDTDLLRLLTCFQYGCRYFQLVYFMESWPGSRVTLP